MCGIAGMVGASDANVLRRMLDTMRHRGPDDLGLFVDDGVAIGQARLSIIDVAGGHQPILSEEGGACIVANGEIYNYRQLAEELGRHSFRTKSDSEVPLHMYEEEGPALAARLDGMFALAIWEGTFSFASEIKALLAVTGSGIREFPNGHWYRTDMGFRRFSSWPTSIHAEMDPVAAARELRRPLAAAVGKQLVFDVPLCAFCS